MQFLRNQKTKFEPSQHHQQLLQPDQSQFSQALGSTSSAGRMWFFRGPSGAGSQANDAGQWQLLRVMTSKGSFVVPAPPGCRIRDIVHDTNNLLVKHDVRGHTVVCLVTADGDVLDLDHLAIVSTDRNQELMALTEAERLAHPPRVHEFFSAAAASIGTEHVVQRISRSRQPSPMRIQPRRGGTAREDASPVLRPMSVLQHSSAAYGSPPERVLSDHTNNDKDEAFDGHPGRAGLPRTDHRAGLSVFVSYSWLNSRLASADKAVGVCDPREIRKRLADEGFSDVWIDHERIKTGDDLFEQIANGLMSCNIVVVCVSNEYASSKNCVRELNFALNVMKLPFISLVVGEGFNWQKTKVGLMFGDQLYLDATQESNIDSCFASLLETLDAFGRRDDSIGTYPAVEDVPVDSEPAAKRRPHHPGIHRMTQDFVALIKKSSIDILDSVDHLPVQVGDKVEMLRWRYDKRSKLVRNGLHWIPVEVLEIKDTPTRSGKSRRCFKVLLSARVVFTKSRAGPMKIHVQAEITEWVEDFLIRRVTETGRTGDVDLQIGDAVEFSQFVHKRLSKKVAYAGFVEPQLTTDGSVVDDSLEQDSYIHWPAFIVAKLHNKSYLVKQGYGMGIMDDSGIYASMLRPVSSRLLRLGHDARLLSVRIALNEGVLVAFPNGYICRKEDLIDLDVSGISNFPVRDDIVGWYPFFACVAENTFIDAETEFGENHHDDEENLRVSLLKGILKASIFIALLTPDYCQSPIHLKELAYAKLLEMPIVYVNCHPDTSFTSVVQFFYLDDFFDLTVGRLAFCRMESLSLRIMKIWEKLNEFRKLAKDRDEDLKNLPWERKSLDVVDGGGIETMDGVLITVEVEPQDVIKANDMPVTEMRRSISVCGLAWVYHRMMLTTSKSSSAFSAQNIVSPSPVLSLGLSWEYSTGAWPSTDGNLRLPFKPTKLQRLVVHPDDVQSAKKYTRGDVIEVRLYWNAESIGDCYLWMPAKILNFLDDEHLLVVLHHSETLPEEALPIVKVTTAQIRTGADPRIHWYPPQQFCIDHNDVPPTPSFRYGNEIMNNYHLESNITEGKERFSMKITKSQKVPRDIQELEYNQLIKLTARLQKDPHPTLWREGISISADGTTATFTLWTPRCITSVHPFLNNELRPYVEIDIVDVGFSEDAGFACLSIGAMVMFYPPFTMLGWAPLSLGYHSMNGRKLSTEGPDYGLQGLPYSKGDRIGVGRDAEQRVFFTRNGHEMFKSAGVLKRCSHLYLGISADGPCVVRIVPDKTQWMVPSELLEKLFGKHRPRVRRHVAPSSRTSENGDTSVPRGDEAEEADDADDAATVDT
ncbi:hypothetical protein HDU84_002734 [Entophlyctis sp. JEL0112]|nr:hypothetical protein HDU84_002734 [Entophlyctis sp. JEL0112]